MIGAVVVALLVALVAGIVVLAPGSADLGPPFQTAGRGPLGLSGLAAGLRSAGVATSDRDRPTLAPGLTLVVNPHDVSHDDAASWMRSLRAGATLIYAAAYPDTFTRALGVSYAAGGPVSPDNAKAAFPPVRVPATVDQAVQLPPGSLSVYDVGRQGSESAMGVIPVGKGAVWFVSEPAWLTNQRVSSLALPLVLPIALAGGRTAAFDTLPPDRLGSAERAPLPAGLGHAGRARGSDRGGAARAGRCGAASGQCGPHRRRTRATWATWPPAWRRSTSRARISAPSPDRWRTPPPAPTAESAIPPPLRGSAMPVTSAPL